MNVICPQCNATYHFPENRIPDRRASFVCKRCGKRVMLDPPAAVGARQEKIPESQNRPSEAVQKSAIQNRTIASEFPETTAFASQKYNLDQLLLPDKKGRYRTRLNKLKLKLLGAVQPTLDELLDQDEQVQRVAAATAYYPAELLLGNGWMTLLYNRYIIVGTNKRLVAVNTDYKMKKPTHYLFQFPYNGIKKVSRGLFGTSLVLARKKSKRRIFTGIRRALTAELKTFIGSKIDPSANLGADALPHDNLCPACFAPLAGKLASCPKCHALFKSPGKAALRSLLLPGWGDVYLGHRFLGVCEMLGSLLIWGIIAAMFFLDDPANLVIGLVFLLFYHGMDGLLTLHMAKKGYSLEKRQPQTAPLGRLSTNRA
jgi:hypothetical protein